jgi:hypothetical protein
MVQNGRGYTVSITAHSHMAPQHCQSHSHMGLTDQTCPPRQELVASLRRERELRVAAGGVNPGDVSLDLCFCLDHTGSMGPWLQACKTQVRGSWPPAALQSVHSSRLLCPRGRRCGCAACCSGCLQSFGCKLACSSLLTGAWKDCFQQIIFTFACSCPEAHPPELCSRQLFPLVFVAHSTGACVSASPIPAHHATRLAIINSSLAEQLRSFPRPPDSRHRERHPAQDPEGVPAAAREDALLGGGLPGRGGRPPHDAHGLHR